MIPNAAQFQRPQLLRVRAAALLAAVLALAVPASAARAARPRAGRGEGVLLSLSRPSVKAGPAIVELVNFGEDPHDLRLQRVGGTKVYGTPVVQPGDVYDLSLRLLPGRYRLWCRSRTTARSA